MKVTIEGTKAEITELLAEIRKREKEYITVPSYINYPYNPYKQDKVYFTWAEDTTKTSTGRREP